MQWLALILVLIGGYATFKLVSFSRGGNRLKYLGLTIACSIFSIIFLTSAVSAFINTQEFSEISGFVKEWGHVLSLAFILSSLAIFIRESKPVFAQFPLPYTALPLFIVISYVLVQDTYAIKEWLLFIYQGGAILVALLMYAVYTYRDNEYGYIMGGIVLFAICYTLFWYLPVINESYPWIWQLLLGFSILITTLGYDRVNEKSFLRQSAG